MRFYTLTIVFFNALLITLGCSAQAVYLNSNNLQVGFAPGGTLFNAANTADFSDTLSSLLKVEPANISTMLSSGFWVTALDEGDNLKGAGSTIYRNRDWDTGPVSDSYDSGYDSLYNKVFKVVKSDIISHIAHYTDNGYQTPLVLHNGPATEGLLKMSYIVWRRM